MREQMLEVIKSIQTERELEARRRSANKFQSEKKWQLRLDNIKEECRLTVAGVTQQFLETIVEVHKQIKAKEDTEANTDTEKVNCTCRSGGEPGDTPPHHNERIHKETAVLSNRVAQVLKDYIKNNIKGKPTTQGGETMEQSTDELKRHCEVAQHRWETLEPTVLTLDSPDTQEEETPNEDQECAQPSGVSYIRHTTAQGTFPTLPPGHVINPNYKGAAEDYDPYWLLKLNQKRMSRELIRRQKPCYHTECQRQQQWHTPPPPMHQRGPYPPQYTQEQVSRMFRM